MIRMTLKNNSIVIALVTVFLFLNSSVVGQSIPLLTDPIKVREIEIISNDLELTPQQTESLIDLYDQYLIDFARVRNGEVRTFEDGLTSAAEQFGFMDFNIPERDVVERLISQGLRAIRAIQRVDKLFFEKIGGMLTETQMKHLERSQVARELEAYNIIVLEMIGELNRGVRTNLRSVVDSNDIELTVEIDELLSTYDQRYLKVAKRSLDAIVEMVNLILDTIDELGIRGLDQQALMMRFLNPESIEDLKSRGDVILKPLQDIAFEMSQLNWKTWNQLDALLSQEDARTIQRQYFSKSYWDSVRGGNAVEKYFGRALAIKDITAEQRASLEEARNTFYSRWKSKTEKHAGVLERSRKYNTIDQMSGEQPGEFDEKLDRLDEQRRDFVDSTNLKIESILGAEIVERLQTRSDKNNKSKEHQAMMASKGDAVVDSKDMDVVVVGSTSIDGEEIVIKDGVAYIEGQDGWEEIELEGIETYSQTTTSKDGKVVTTQISAKDSSRKKEAVQKTKSEPLEGGILIPDPIIPSFPRKAAEILGLDSSGAPIVEAVYDDYRDQYKEVYEAAKGAGTALGSEQELSQGARLKKQMETNKGYAEQVAVLDTIFFDDLAALTGLKREDKNLLMLESHRNRQRTSAPEDPFGWSGGDGDHIDLVNLYLLSTKSDALLSNISNDSVQGIHGALQNYNDQITGAHHQYVKTTSDLKRMQNAMYLMEDADNMDMAQKMRTRWMESFAAVRDAKRAYMLANQMFMESMLKSLPQEDYWTVRSEFVNQAYPDVFSSGKDASTMLAAASAIQSLDTTQQSKIDKLTERYRYDYWDLCERMIQNHETNATADSGEGLFNQEDMRRELQKETLKFERSELYDRVQMRLRLILNDDQIKDVPGLRPSADSPKKWSSRELQGDVAA